MDDKKLLELLRELEWGGDDHGDWGTCQFCGQTENGSGHKPECVFADALAFVQDRCEKQAPWDLLAGDFGRGQVIAMPSEPRVYGLWGGKSWWQRVGGEIIHYSTRQAASAELHNNKYSDSKVREIGTDGLPVPESE